MDVDNFKQINDKMGHSAGDAVLQSVGEALKGAFRKGDIVSRLGGDEFVAFLPYAGDIGVVTEKVKAMMQRINEIKQGNEQDIIVSVSVGLAQYPKDGCLFEELYKRADKALYSAKNSGKGKIAVYKEELDDSSKSEAAE
ncbi:MAG: GGDEF domain-containing protein [Eubacteriales bacterium]|nr:GGDEF domain-containing protein [Eubacteriales bacterium]MDD4512483.1 GGDEF domain-containing protein [Eubacteriales bacterium]